MRTVKAVLDADVKPFNDALDKAAEEAAKLDRKVEALDRDLDKIPGDALLAAAAVRSFGENADHAAKQLAGIGDKASSLAILDEKIKQSRDEVKKLTEEFVRTGKVDVFEKLGTAQGKHKSLLDIRGTLAKELKEGAVEGATAGVGLVQGIFTKGLTSVFDAVPGEVKAALGIVAAAFALALTPAIGGAIGAALLGGIGLGGIGAGVALAMKDQQVAKSVQDLGDHVTKTLGAAGESFKAPMIASVGIIGSSFDRLAPMLGRGLDSLAPKLEHLAGGVGRMFEKIGPGLEKALKGAGPVIDALSDNLPTLGRAIGDLFGMLGSHSEEAAKAMRFLVVAIAAAVKMVEYMIDGLLTMWKGADRVLGWIAEKFGVKMGTAAKESADETGKSFEDLADKTKIGGLALDEFNSKLNQTADTMDTRAAAMAGKWFDSMMALDQATLGFEKSLTATSEAFKKNGDAIDIQTKKGQDNRTAILAAASANMQLYQANVAASMSSADAAVIYDQNTARLEKQMRQAGYTAQEIDGLIGKYKGVPATVNTMIAMQGLTEAINSLDDAIRKANQLDGRQISMRVVTNNFVNTIMSGVNAGLRTGQSYAYKNSHGAVRRAATGVIVPPSDPGTTLFGEPETGGEAFIPMRGISQMRAMSLMQTVGDGYGLNVSPVGGGGPTSVVVQVGITATGGGQEVAALLNELGRKNMLQFPAKVIVS